MANEIDDVINKLTAEPVTLKKRPSNPDVDKAFTPEIRDQLGYLNPYRTLSDHKDMDEIIGLVSNRTKGNEKAKPIIDLLTQNKDYLNSLRSFDRQYDKDFLDFQKSSDYKNALIEAILGDEPIKRSDWYKKTGDLFRSKYGYDPSVSYEGQPIERWNSKGRDLTEEEKAAIRKKYPGKNFFLGSTFLSHDNQTLEKDLSGISLDDLKRYIAYKYGAK